MEYKEEANIRSIGNLRAAEAEALQTSAATIQKWANRGASVYEKLVTDNAIMEANKVDVTLMTMYNKFNNPDSFKISELKKLAKVGFIRNLRIDL